MNLKRSHFAALDVSSTDGNRGSNKNWVLKLAVVCVRELSCGPTTNIKYLGEVTLFAIPRRLPNPIRHGLTVTKEASCPAFPSVYINKSPVCEGELPLKGKIWTGVEVLAAAVKS